MDPCLLSLRFQHICQAFAVLPHVRNNHSQPPVSVCVVVRASAQSQELLLLMYVSHMEHSMLLLLSSFRTLYLL
jgi:hypothetical protein